MRSPSQVPSNAHFLQETVVPRGQLAPALSGTLLGQVRISSPAPVHVFRDSSSASRVAAQADRQVSFFFFVPFLAPLLSR